MKKILHITNRLVIGGPSRHVAMLANGLQSDYEVLVVGGSAAPGEVLALDLFAGLKNQPILIPELSRKLCLSRDYKVYRKLRKIIHEFQPDIVHTHTSKVGALGRLAAKKEGVAKIVHTYHGLIFENYFSGILNKGIIKLDRYLAGFTHHIIALSQQQKESLTSLYKITDSNKLSVIPLALDIDEFQFNKESRLHFRNQYQLKPIDIAIGIIGRLVPIKNLKLFLDGIKYLKVNSKTSFSAFIVGDGFEKESLMAYAKEIGLNSNEDVYFTSWLKDLNFVYSGLDIVVLTSLSEGTPMSLMEAQLAGKAIIASDVGGVVDVLADESGVLFDLNKPKSFFNELLKLTQDDNKRIQLGNRANEYALKAYNKQNMIDRTAKLYNS